MSRFTEISNRLLQLSHRDSAPLTQVETTTLWSRFKRVRSAILTALVSQQPQTQRKLNTFSWSGEDSGIHDHTGHIQGVVHGIKLDIHIQGTTIDAQTRFVTNNDGSWRLTQSREHDVEVHGSYVSADGYKGEVRFQIGNADTPYEAYWVETTNGRLKLQQVVCGGNVFDADHLEDGRGGACIPGTSIGLPRFIKMK